LNVTNRFRPLPLVLADLPSNLEWAAPIAQRNPSRGFNAGCCPPTSFAQNDGNLFRWIEAPDGGFSVRRLVPKRIHPTETT